MVLSGTGLIKGFNACIYIEKIYGDVDRPTNRPSDQQGEYRAICLFRKLENRKKAEICNMEYERSFDIEQDGIISAIYSCFHGGQKYSWQQQ